VTDSLKPQKLYLQKKKPSHWAKLEEARRRQGYGPADQIKGKQTLADLNKTLSDS